MTSITKFFLSIETTSSILLYSVIKIGFVFYTFTLTYGTIGAYDSRILYASQWIEWQIYVQFFFVRLPFLQFFFSLWPFSHHHPYYMMQIQCIQHKRRKDPSAIRWSTRTHRYAHILLRTKAINHPLEMGTMLRNTCYKFYRRNEHVYWELFTPWHSILLFSFDIRLWRSTLFGMDFVWIFSFGPWLIHLYISAKSNVPKSVEIV